MHNYYSRLNAISSFFMSVLAAQLALIALVHIAITPSSSPSISASVPSVKYSTHWAYSSYRNHADLTLSIETDLAPLFVWNTKLLFVSAVVESSNSKYIRNSDVIWDAIIAHPEDAFISIKNVSAKYRLSDIANKLPNSKADLVIQYQIVPYSGFLRTFRHVIPEAIAFPPRVATKRK